MYASCAFLDRHIDQVHSSVDAKELQSCNCDTGDATFVQVNRRYVRHGGRSHSFVSDLIGSAEMLRVMSRLIWIGATNDHGCFGEYLTNGCHCDWDTKPPEARECGN